MILCIGARLEAHDSNISVCRLTGNEPHEKVKVVYSKSERVFQQKHHVAYLNNETTDWIKDVIWTNFEVQDDDIVSVFVVADTQADIFSKYVPYFEQMFPNNHVMVRHVDHHKAHILSTWPLKDGPIWQDLINGTTNLETRYVVLDGFGNDDICSSVHQVIASNPDNDTASGWIGDNLVPIEQSICYTVPKENGSIGLAFAETARSIGIEGHDLDLAGKLMAYQMEHHADYRLALHLANTWGFHEIEVLARKIMDKPTTVEKLEATATFHRTIGLMINKYFMEFTTNRHNKMAYAGGVAHNIIFNTNLSEYFDELYIPPHAGDEGLSLGAILQSIGTSSWATALELEGFPFCQQGPIEPAQHTVEDVIDDILKDKWVAVFQGLAEIGPRALGNRSILADPRFPDVKQDLNQHIKHRESYRPFGCCVREEDFDDYFWGRKCQYMLHTQIIKQDAPVQIPAVKSVHNNSRVQVVTKESNPKLYEILTLFKERTGCAVLLNTSLNGNGMPIANTLQDAENAIRSSNLPLKLRVL